MVTIILLGLIIALETFSQYCIQKRVETKKFFYLILGMLGYGGVAYVYYLMLNAGNKLAIANATWNVGTGLTVTLVGWLAFNQKLTMKQILGLIISITGVILLN